MASPWTASHTEETASQGRGWDCVFSERIQTGNKSRSAGIKHLFYWGHATRAGTRPSQLLHLVRRNKSRCHCTGKVSQIRFADFMVTNINTPQQKRKAHPLILFCLLVCAETLLEMSPLWCHKGATSISIYVYWYLYYLYLYFHLSFCFFCILCFCIFAYTGILISQRTLSVFCLLPNILEGPTKHQEAVNRGLKPSALFSGDQKGIIY